jgi:antitoxin ParD1/3/4
LLPIFGNFVLNTEIMGRNTSISLGDHFENFIEHSVADGRFNNASEVIRAGLRLLEEEENKVITLRKAINEGLNSGRAVNFKPKKHLELLKAKRKANG